MRAHAKQAHAIDAAKAAKLGQAALLLWVQAHRVRVAQSQQERNVLRSAFLAWSDRMAIVRRQHALADSIERLRNEEAARRSLHAWRASLHSQIKKTQEAAGVAKRNLLAKTLRTWRQRLVANQTKTSEAVKARAFFLQKDAFGAWAFRYRRRKQEQWLAERTMGAVRQAFDGENQPQ